MWDPLAGSLAGRYRLIIPDLPGHGLREESAAAISAALPGSTLETVDGCGFAEQPS